MFRSMVSVPKFRGYEKVLSFYNFLIECLFDSLSNPLFVKIKSGTVNMSVAELDGCKDGLLTFFGLNFGGTIADQRNSVTIVQFEDALVLICINW